jgi:hypothetical protein
VEAVRKRISSVMGPWVGVGVSGWVGDWVVVVEGKGRAVTYGNNVPPGSPLLPDFLDGSQAHPVGPAALDDEVAKQRAGKEQRREEQGAERVPCRDRPQAEQVQHLARRGGVAVSRAREHHVRDARAEQA